MDLDHDSDEEAEEAEEAVCSWLGTASRDSLSLFSSFSLSSPLGLQAGGGGGGVDQGWPDDVGGLSTQKERLGLTFDLQGGKAELSPEAAVLHPRLQKVPPVLCLPDSASATFLLTAGFF